MDYKEKINNFLKGIGFTEKDGKLINSDGICEIQSSFDELGNWGLRWVVSRSKLVDGTVLEKLHEHNELTDIFLLKLFQNSIKNEMDYQ